MIKVQTVATRRKEGGRKEEGREEECFLERRGKQDMQKEKEEGKHRVACSKQKLSLQGLCKFQGQTGKDKTLTTHFLVYKTLERRAESTDTNRHSHGLLHR